MEELNLKSAEEDHFFTIMAFFWIYGKGLLQKSDFKLNWSPSHTKMT